MFSKIMFKCIIRTVAIVLGAGIALPALGATGAVTSSITFQLPISLTKNSDIDFGIVAAGVPGNYTLTPAGTISVSGPGEILGGTPSAGSVTIRGSASQLINISEGQHTQDNGVNIANVRCSYDDGPDGVCNVKGVTAPGSGKTLLIGATAVVNGTQADGSVAVPSFTITVVYQ